jgi:hypothetical protein
MDDNQNVQTPAGENETPVIIPAEEMEKSQEEAVADEATTETSTEETA